MKKKLSHQNDGYLLILMVLLLKSRYKNIQYGYKFNVRRTGNIRRTMKAEKWMFKVGLAYFKYIGVSLIKL